MARAFSLFVYASFFVSIIASVSPALAAHEGPYIIDEGKDVENVFLCRNEESARAILEKVPNGSGVNSLIDELLRKQECFIGSGTVTVIEQVGNDVADWGGKPWRIILVEGDEKEGENTVVKYFYIITYGTETTVQKEPSGLSL